MNCNRMVSAFVLLCGIAACNRSEPPAATQTPVPAATPIPARAPAVGIYVTNETSGDLSVIDAATNAVVATITLGKRPRGIVASPDRTLLYVALSGSPVAGPGVDESKLPPPDRSADGIGVVDVRERKLVRVLPSGPDPEQVAISQDGKEVYVANEDAGQLSVIDTTDGHLIQSFKIGDEPEGVTVEPGGTRVWVTSEADGAVFVADLAARKIARSVKVGPRPRSNGGTLTEIDVRRLAPIRTIDLGKGMRPMGTRVSPDGKFLYISTGRSKMAVMLDTASNMVVASVEAGDRPWGIGLAPDAKTLYTANGPSNDMSVIDIASRQVTKKVAVGRGPWGLAVVEAPADAR